MLAIMSRWKPGAADRLAEAALTLFHEQGYEQTTIAQIAEAAGLTKRTFFRHFADKREVLFDGSHQLERHWVAGIEAAPPDAGLMTAAAAGFDPVAAMFTERHRFALTRSRIVAANPELQERELINVPAGAAAIWGGLRPRGASPAAPTLASQASVTVFHVAFARWVQQSDPAALHSLLRQSLAELRSVTTT